MFVFVINLDRDTDRLANVSAGLRAAGLPFERVKGVLGAALSPEELRRHYDDGKAKWRQARKLTPQEIGCALSHVKTYRTMSRQQIPCALILEDDVVIPRNLGELLAELSAHLLPSEPVVCLLSPASTAAPSLASLCDGRFQLAPFSGGFFATSYVLTCTAADALAEELYPVGDVADNWTHLHRFGVVTLRVVTPPMIVQDNTTFGTPGADAFKEVFGTNLSAQWPYRLRRARNVLWHQSRLLLRVPRLRRRTIAATHPADELLDLTAP